MSFPYIVRTGFVLCLVVFLPGSPARAEDPRFLSAYHTEYGLKLLNDGKDALAIERFVKAFLLDPQNKVAKDSLQKISAEQSGESSRGLKILRFVDQVEYLIFLTARYDGLTAENTKLREFLRTNKKVADNTALKEKFQNIERQVTAKSSALPHVGLIGFTGNVDKNMDLSVITDELAVERENLAKEVGFWEEENNQLRALRRDVLSQSPVETAGKYQAQLDEIHERVSEKDQLLSVQQQNIEYFKTELSAMRESFSALQDKLKSADVKFADLNSRIAAMSVELFEKNKILGEKDARAANLEKDLTVAGEKLSLVQRIIQEKDDRIAALEKEMEQVRVMISSPGNSSDSQVAKLQADFKDFRDQFQAQMEKNRDRIITLQIQYAEISSKYESLLKDAQVKDVQVAALKSTVAQKTVLADQYREAFFTIDEKADQMVGMIEIYRGKLAEAKKNLSAKEAEVKKLQGALFDVNVMPVKHSNAADSQVSPKESEGFQNQYDLTFSKAPLINPSLQER